MNPALTASQFLQALCLFREARGESQACKAAILSVIRNRAEDAKNRWPKSTSKVIIQSQQFSSFNPTDPNSKLFPIEGDSNWASWLQCCDVVTVPLTADPTDGANSYHSIPDAGFTYKNTEGKTVTLMPPSWADPAKLTVQIGNTKFYRL